jgi:hypothetical protein
VGPRPRISARYFELFAAGRAQDPRGTIEGPRCQGAGQFSGVARLNLCATLTGLWVVEPFGFTNNDASPRAGSPFRQLRERLAQL